MITLPKPIFNLKTEQTQKLSLDTKLSNISKIDPLMLEKRLRQKRSAEYMQALKTLDLGGHDLDQTKFKEFSEAVKREFPEVEIDSFMGMFLVGIVAKCYLGASYDVHTLDIMGSILTHYKYTEPMPAALERARSLALYGDYAFIEVYTDALRAVKNDGSVAVVK